METIGVPNVIHELRTDKAWKESFLQFNTAYTASFSNQQKQVFQQETSKM